MCIESVIISEIQSDICSIEENTALYNETNFDCRADAIDFIDFHIIDRIETLQPAPQLYVLRHHAERLKRRLEKIDITLFTKLREGIRAGIYAQTSFIEMIGRYITYDNSEQPDKIGYDNLDLLINGLLADQGVPAETKVFEPEMVFYQKTPARIIFELSELAQLGPGDVFFDIGAGLGQVAIVINLISGVKSIGVEYDPGYCNYAKVCAAQLNLSGVEFINADARNENYSHGTVFFLYTPFKGNILQQMLEVLKKEAQKRTIRIFTYGPCSRYVGTLNWLNCVNGKADNTYKLYEFHCKTV
jgi:SAM-dependent methyltransferase